jgi:MFS family permease
VAEKSLRSKLGSRPQYPWLVVGFLWFAGFFNYADRQAVYSVFPLLKSEFGLSPEQQGLLGMAFMVVYALSSPFSGYTVDRLPRRLLIASGLLFWSLICSATALSRNFYQLIFFRAAEGLGESFYFPASMSLLSDYHGPTTRSKALGIHQTSVYLGTAGGAALAGYLGEKYGWRSPFWILGLAGMVYAGLLGYWLIEPRREPNERANANEPRPGNDPLHSTHEREGALVEKVVRILTNPAATLLLLVFVGANFVAATFLTWLPSYIFDRFELGIATSSFTSTFWPLASLPGAVLGGVAADWWSRRSRGGRIRVQSMGLIAAAPFVFLTGWSATVPVLIVALIGAGVCKGIYDSNIFASLFDVIPPEDRGTAAGLMNTLGWTGGLAAPYAVAKASRSFGMGATIASTAAIYLVGGLLALAAARLAESRHLDMN